jgi:hypothetical protein
MAHIAANVAGSTFIPVAAAAAATPAWASGIYIQYRPGID